MLVLFPTTEIQIENTEVAEMVLFVATETTEILQSLDREIMKMDQKISGSRKYRNDKSYIRNGESMENQDS